MSVLLTMLVIPMPPYSTILQKCEMKDPVYELLANGFIDHGENRDEVQILCDGDAARTIVDYITDVAPQFFARRSTNTAASGRLELQGTITQRCRVHCAIQAPNRGTCL